ncbi:MAG: hypothetical protein ACKO38_14035 [Planctomycetota bacterium]
MTRIAWITEPRLSPAYALAAAATGRQLVNERLRVAAADACRIPGNDLDDFRERLWSALTRSVVAAASSPSNTVRSAVDHGSPTRLENTPQVGNPLSGVLEVSASFDREFAACVPRLASELPLRTRPFLELWEARGPGLLRQLFGRQDGSPLDATDNRCLIAWVYPATGGGGWSELGGRVVFFEALLTNAFEPLSELLRLAWHVAFATLPTTDTSRLDSTVGEIAARFGIPRSDAAAAALIPSVLAAGEYVELAMADERHTALALQAWMGLDPTRAVELAKVMPAA